MSEGVEPQDREQVARGWMKRARKAANDRRAPAALAVTYGLIGVAWAILHLAERVESMAWVSRPDRYSPPEKVIERAEADLR